MGIKDDINRILRDHEGYTGDGRGGVGDLPIGDRSTARKPISKRDLREVLGAVHDSVADPAAAAGQAAADAADAAERAELAAAGVEHPVSYAPQALTAPQRLQARSNIGAADSATAVVNTRTITAGAGLTGGGNLTANRTIAADFASEAEALAGISLEKIMSPARVARAIAASDMWAGHSWRVVTSLRALGTAYQNTTGAAIQVSWLGGSGSLFQWSVNGTAWVSLNSASYTQTAPIIGPGQYYRFSGGTLVFVAEYRND